MRFLCTGLRAGKRYGLSKLQVWILWNHYSESSFAKNFTQQLAGNFLHDGTRGWFAIEENGHWHLDWKLAMCEMEKSIIEMLPTIPIFDEDDKSIKYIKNLHARWLALRVINSALTLSSAKKTMSIDSEQLNHNHKIIGCPDGKIELQTGKVSKANPKDYITMSTICNMCNMIDKEPTAVAEIP